MKRALNEVQLTTRFNNATLNEVCGFSLDEAALDEVRQTSLN